MSHQLVILRVQWWLLECNALTVCTFHFRIIRAMGKGKNEGNHQIN